MIKFLIIEGCNFVDFPVGGQLSFAKQLVDIYGSNVALVGVTERIDIPIGKWTKIKINEKEMDFFAFRRTYSSGKKPFMPSRITDYLAIKKYRNSIISKNNNAIIQAPELLIAIKYWGWKSLCYRFPGVENPLLMPRYKWGTLFAQIYEKQLFIALQKVDVILASASKAAIQNLVERSMGLLKSESINQFPTRVDTGFFKPIIVDKKNELAIHHSDKIIVTCGRINFVKGWDLILESFKEIRKNISNIQLYYVGDGEDRERLEKKIDYYNLSTSVHITGYQKSNQVLNWLNIADIVLVGSHKEGWSISMLETLACGKAIISTSVSGAKEMINEGENGYVVESRNPIEFAEAIKKGLELKNVPEKSVEIASKYALSSLKEDLNKLWLREQLVPD
jgi:glycosyltransferase involved in cell wall biosynthesis